MMQFVKTHDLFSVQQYVCLMGLDRKAGVKSREKATCLFSFAPYQGFCYN